MIQVRLLVCGCLGIDFLCCMLYASPLPPKLHWNRLKEIPSSYLLLLFLCCATFFLDETKQNPSFKETENTVYFFRSPQCVLYPIYKDICLLFLKIAPLIFVFTLGSDSINPSIPPPPTCNGNDEQAPPCTAVRSAFWGGNELTHSIWLMPAYLKLLKAVENGLFHALPTVSWNTPGQAKGFRRQNVFLYCYDWPTNAHTLSINIYFVITSPLHVSVVKPPSSRVLVTFGAPDDGGLTTETCRGDIITKYMFIDSVRICWSVLTTSKYISLLPLQTWYKGR
jgi:hypothetical protein